MPALIVLTRRERMLRWIGMGALLIGGSLLYRLDPESGIGWVCPFHALTGFDCFGCGLTRSLRATLHGDLMSAIGYHAMGPIILGLFLIVFLLWLYEASRGFRLSVLGSGKVRLGAIMGTGIVWALYGTIRMVLEISRPMIR